MLLRADAQDETRDVVVLARESHEGVYILHHSFQSFARGFGRRVLDAKEEPRFAVFLSGIIDSFHHSVGEDEEQVARLKLHAAGWAENFFFREKWKSKRRASRRE